MVDVRREECVGEAKENLCKSGGVPTVCAFPSEPQVLVHSSTRASTGRQRYR